MAFSFYNYILKITFYSKYSFCLFYVHELVEKKVWYLKMCIYFSKGCNHPLARNQREDGEKIQGECEGRKRPLSLIDPETTTAASSVTSQGAGLVGWLELCPTSCCVLVCATVCALLSETLLERHTQQRLSRCAEERGKKLEEQRRRETERRAAAGHRRRQQQEAQKVRGQLGWQPTPVGLMIQVFVPHFMRC